jgi:hypothetical protein
MKNCFSIDLKNFIVINQFKKMLISGLDFIKADFLLNNVLFMKICKLKKN